MDQLGRAFSGAEHAARAGSDRDYRTSLAHMIFLAAWEAEKAKNAARASLVVQVINMALLALLIYLNVWRR